MSSISETDILRNKRESKRSKITEPVGRSKRVSDFTDPFHSGFYAEPTTSR